MIAQSNHELIFQDYIQWGFAGFCFILVAIIVWLIKTYNSINERNSIALVNVIEKNNKVLANIFDGLKSVKESEDQLKYSISDHNSTVKEQSREISLKVDNLRELLLSRPCTRG